ncbi:MAG: glycosyltransferase family 39 protein [Bacteroidota bacterium]
MKQTPLFLTRLPLAVFGIAMILLLMPHESPTELTSFIRTVHGGELVFALNLPGGASIPIPTNIFFALVGTLTVVLLAVSESFKRFLTTAIGEPRSVLPTIIGFSLLVVSLLPPEPYFVSAGSTVVLILALNTLGFSLAGTGLAPLLPNLRNIGSLRERLARIVIRVQTMVLDSSRRSFLAVCFLLFFVSANLISLFVFDHLPHVQDSIAQVFHAKILAQGSLTAPAPIDPDFFQFLQMILRDRWYSQYPPGHLLILASAIVIGIPWIVNPLLGSFSILLLYFLGKELYGEETGRVASLLGLVSPFLLFMSSEFMNHTPALFFYLVFLLFFAKAIRSGRMKDGMLSGGALGWFILTRPYSAAALAIPFIVYGLTILVRRRSSVWPAGLGFTISLLLFLGILLGFNFLTNGDPLVFGFQALWGGQVNPGFGALNAGEMHTPLKGLTQTLSSLNGLNKYLFEWPLPSLIFVAVLFASHGKVLWDRLLLASAVSILAAYFFYWFHDWCFGPRFLYEASGPLIVLTARGILIFPDWAREILGTRVTDERMRAGLTAFVILLVVIGFASNVPAHIRNYSNAYWGVDGTALALVRERGIDRGIVFVPPSKFGGVFPLNDPFLRSELIFARDLGEANNRLLEHFPALSGYRIQGDTLVVLSPPLKSSLQNP